MMRFGYLTWFLVAVSLAMSAVVAFNYGAARYILQHRAGASVQTMSGFERALKPAWLDALQPDVVFVGTSRVRDAFDPTLIDRAFAVHSFNYGMSGMTSYEARRFVQDAAAHASVKLIVLSLDAFTAGNPAQKTGAGFVESRLAVTGDGVPTPYYGLWLFAARYLSGSALGMHALAVYALAHLSPQQSAADRPDIFEAYSHMTPAIFHRDEAFRQSRTMRMSPWDRSELQIALASVCHRPIRLMAYFPPDNAAMLARYEANDPAGFQAFKVAVRRDVDRHNATCQGKVSLFDFMRPNAITREPLTQGVSESYVDLVHVRPPTGLRLFGVMYDPAHAGADGALRR